MPKYTQDHTLNRDSMRNIQTVFLTTYEEFGLFISSITWIRRLFHYSTHQFKTKKTCRVEEEHTHNHSMLLHRQFLPLTPQLQQFQPQQAQGQAQQAQGYGAGSPAYGVDQVNQRFQNMNVGGGVAGQPMANQYLGQYQPPPLHKPIPRHLTKRQEQTHLEVSLPSTLNMRNQVWLEVQQLCH